MLSPEAVARLDAICAQLDHTAANAQVAVVTVHDLDGDDAARVAAARGLPLQRRAHAGHRRQRAVVHEAVVDVLRIGLRHARGVAFALIDIDEQALAVAQDALRTGTKDDTVNAALREVAALAARRRDLRRATEDGRPDLAIP